jgi:hypothetical protein
MPSGFVNRINGGNQRKHDLTVIVDACSLIRMASLINPQDVSDRAPDTNPTLLSYLEHLGKLGAQVIIPESVVFESTGHRGDGTQLTRQFEQDIEYPKLRRFLQDVADGKVKNVRIARTPYADTHLEELEHLKNDFPAFNRYRWENLPGFGDRDIVKMFDRSKIHGNTFVITEDRGLTDILEETVNMVERPVGIVSAIRACKDIQRVAPIEWIHPATGINDFRDYANAFTNHENMRKEEANELRIAEGKKPQRTLSRTMGPGHKGYARVQKSEPHLDEALHDMLRSHQAQR